MRTGFTLFAALAFLLVSAHGVAGEQRRMKWMTSVYVGPKGRSLRYPEGVACGRSDFVVADTGNNRLVRYTYESGSVTAESEFPLEEATPIIVQMNSKGAMYFLDGAERRIAGVSAAGEDLGVVEPRGLPSSAEVIPKSFRIDSDDNIYVLDVFSGRVLVLDDAGQYIRHLPLPDEYGFFSDLTIDRQGRILLLDSVEAVVYSTTGAGDRFARLTNRLKEYVNFPTRLTTDRDGTIYLVDQYGSGLALIAADGAFLGRRLGMGWSDGNLYFPSQVCINDDGIVFIADRNNSRVQVFAVSEE